MTKFLLPFAEGRQQTRLFSSAAMLVSSIAFGILLSLQTKIGIVLFLLGLILFTGSLARTRWRAVLGLAAKFEIVILFWVFLEPFLYGETIAFTINLPWTTLNVYVEGIQFGVLIGLRMFTLIVLFLGTFSHMTLAGFIGALRTIHVPASVIGSFLIMFRYIPLFIEERTRMQESQLLRGYEQGKRWERIKSLGYLIGSTIDRALDRSISVYEAMTLRGFGKGISPQGIGFRRSDFVFLPLLMMLVIIIYYALPLLLELIF